LPTVLAYVTIPDSFTASIAINATQESTMTELLANLDAELEKFVTQVVAPAAVQVDAAAQFPRDTIRAFQSSGLSGLISAREHGGAGGGVRDASKVVERIGRVCGSTAMIVTMHYSAVQVIESFGSVATRQAVAQGKLLTTLAFSEAGSRSHFWAPTSTAEKQGDAVVLNARKSWVTSANKADVYVWSSKPLAAEGFSSIWLVDRGTTGIQTGAAFEGMGLKGNDSVPVTANNAKITADRLLGEDGKGADVMLGVVLPIFSLLNASASVGIMAGAIERTIAHMSATRFEHLDSAIKNLPTARAFLARMQIKKDAVHALLNDSIGALEKPSDITMLRVLEIKAAAGEAATEVTDLAMRVCGGAAFRKEGGVERYFRDARAATVMAPTTDQLYDFIGRALCGMDLFA
jgi:alkylation response protein AidB-like acyl-CoA dehydrogenase